MLFYCTEKSESHFGSERQDGLEVIFNLAIDCEGCSRKSKGCIREVTTSFVGELIVGVIELWWER